MSQVKVFVTDGQRDGRMSFNVPHPRKMWGAIKRLQYSVLLFTLQGAVAVEWLSPWHLVQVIQGGIRV